MDSGRSRRARACTAARGSEASGMGERTLSALFSWNKQNKGEKGMLSGQITCHQPCLLELSFLCREEWPYSRKGRPTLKGKEKVTTGMRMAPSTLHGLRCWL